MFVRIKKHRSGNESVVVVAKSDGRYRQLKNFGVTKSESHKKTLIDEAYRWILCYGGQQQLEFENLRTPEQSIDYALSQIQNIHMDAPFKILSRVYDDIGFNAVNDDILRYLAIARVCEPQANWRQRHILSRILTRM